MRMVVRVAGIGLILAVIATTAWAAPPSGHGGHGGGGGGGHSGGYHGGSYGGHGGYHGGYNSTGEILFGVGAILGGVGAINNGPAYAYPPGAYYQAPQPVYVQPQTVYEPSDDDATASVPANPPPAPMKKTTITISNPATNSATLSYTLDGTLYQIKPGETQELQYEYEIAFDRGNGSGSTRYSLTKGVYTFTPKDDGTWELYNSDN